MRDALISIPFITSWLLSLLLEAISQMKRSSDERDYSGLRSSLQLAYIVQRLATTVRDHIMKFRITPPDIDCTALASLKQIVLRRLKTVSFVKEWYYYVARPCDQVKQERKQRRNQLGLKLHRCRVGVSAACRWHGPAAIPRAIPTCNDRNNQNYVGECSKTGFLSRNAPFANWQYYRQLPCALDLPMHGPNFRVCANCVECTEYSQWFKIAKAKMCNPPPNNLPWGRRETKRWRGFWTRMCRLCEIREQYLVRARQGYGGVPRTPAPIALQAQMQDYPTNTCTCLRRLQNVRLCRNHYREQWQNLKIILEPQRNQNANSLRTWASHPITGRLWTASKERQDNRYYLRDGCMLRACRCGDEVTDQTPEVYQCMACEGIIQVTELPLPFAPPQPQHFRNSASPGAPFALGRNPDPRTC